MLAKKSARSASGSGPSRLSQGPGPGRLPGQEPLEVGRAGAGQDQGDRLERPRDVESCRRQDEVDRPLVRVEGRQVADHPGMIRDGQLAAEPAAIAARHLGMLDPHPQFEDPGVGDPPPSDGIGLEPGLDDDGVGLGEQADLVGPGIRPVHRVARRAEVEERRDHERGLRRPGRPVGRVGEHRVREADREDRVVIPSDVAQAGDDRHVRLGDAPGRPVRDVAEEPAGVSLHRDVPDGEPADVRAVDGRLGRRVDPLPGLVGEVPEIMSVAGQDVDLVPGRDEPPDHRPAVILGAADDREIPMDEPGNLHRRASGLAIVGRADPDRSNPQGIRRPGLVEAIGVAGGDVVAVDDQPQFAEARAEQEWLCRDRFAF